MDEVWGKSTWRNKKKHQMPDYEDKDQLNKVVNSLCNLPPLVFAGEVRNLKNDLAKLNLERLLCCKAVIALKVLKNSQLI